MNPRSLSHIGIAVPDLDAAIPLFRKLFGCSPGPVRRNEAQGVTLVHFDLGNAVVELISPTSTTGAIARFLDKHPKGGLHHLALACDGIAETREALAPIRPAGDESLNVFGQPMIFLHPSDTSGVLIELEEHG
jgi:methylmalonyl-CoA/ethylmalonyl-CoA epimerase